MNRDYRPGKGVHVELEEELADWLTDVLHDVYGSFGTSATYIRPEEATEELQSRLSGADWEYTSDSYGDKMSNAYKLQNGQELRVSVVVNRKGELRLDIRTWFDPEDN
jgi:hypothetical protein